MTDETGGKPLSLASAALAMARRERVTEPLEPTHRGIPIADLAELIAAAEECAEAMDAATKKKFKNMVPYPGKMGDETRELSSVRRLRAAVEKVRAT